MTSTSTFSDEETPGAPTTEPVAATAPLKPGVEAERPRGRPPLQSACVLYGELPGEGEPRVVISQSALRQIEAHCLSNTGVEVGGALLGYAYTHNAQLFVEVKAAIPALSPDQGPVHFTFTADVWVQLHHDRAAYPDLDIVGWFHTHPDLGVFFSADDSVVQAAAFTQPWQVALVVDPLRREACFFGWVAEELWALPGFYEMLGPDSAESVPSVDWAVASHSGLNETPLPARVAVHHADAAWPPISPWVGVFLGGLSLILSLITLILVARM